MTGKAESDAELSINMSSSNDNLLKVKRLKFPIQPLQSPLSQMEVKLQTQVFLVMLFLSSLIMDTVPNVKAQMSLMNAFLVAYVIIFSMLFVIVVDKENQNQFVLKLSLMQLVQ